MSSRVRIILWEAATGISFYGAKAVQRLSSLYAQVVLEQTPWAPKTLLPSPPKVPLPCADLAVWYWKHLPGVFTALNRLLVVREARGANWRRSRLRGRNGRKRHETTTRAAFVVRMQTKLTRVYENPFAEAVPKAQSGTPKPLVGESIRIGIWK